MAVFHQAERVKIVICISVRRSSNLSAGANGDFVKRFGLDFNRLSVPSFEKKTIKGIKM